MMGKVQREMLSAEAVIEKCVRRGKGDLDWTSLRAKMFRLVDIGTHPK